MNDLVLSIPKLREALDRTLTAVEREHGEMVTLTGDYYWHLPVQAAFDMTVASPELDAGQLSDDLDELNDLLTEDETEGVPALWHNLQHLIGLLRALEAQALP